MATTTASPFPTLHLPPNPLPTSALPVGLLLPRTTTPESTPLNPNTTTSNTPALSDRDFDDAGSQWYKDVITLSTTNGWFLNSLGGVKILESQPPKDQELGTIEAEEMRVRSLKDAVSALKKVENSEEGKKWVELVRKQQEEGKLLGFVTAVREVKNASYKHAKVVKTAGGMWEVVREVHAEEAAGKKRRDSGLDVITGSKWDAVGVEVRRVTILNDGSLELGDVLRDEDVRTML